MNNFLQRILQDEEMGRTRGLAEEEFKTGGLVSLTRKKEKLYLKYYKIKEK